MRVALIIVGALVAYCVAEEAGEEAFTEAQRKAHEEAEWVAPPDFLGSTVVPFTIKPSGASDKVIAEVGGRKCMFAWQASGGTNEHWEMNFYMDPAHNAYGCDVTLPDHGSSSYLLFQKFSLSISGLKITESLENLVKLSNDHTELEDEEYTFGKDRIAITSTKEFRGQLFGLRIYSEETTLTTHEQPDL